MTNAETKTEERDKRDHDSADYEGENRTSVGEGGSQDASRAGYFPHRCVVLVWVISLGARPLSSGFPTIL